MKKALIGIILPTFIFFTAQLGAGQAGSTLDAQLIKAASAGDTVAVGIS